MDLPPSLAEKLYLLAYNLEKNRMHRVPKLGQALRAAALTELYRAGALVDDNGRTRPAGSAPALGIADGLASEVFHQVTASPPRSWAHWVTTDDRAALDSTRDRLDGAGWIEVGEPRMFGRVPAAAVSLHDRESVQALNRECGRVLRGEVPLAQADPDVVALVALAAAGDVITLVSARERRTWPAHLAAFTTETGPAATALAR